jgi:hypothetical protein
MGIKLQPHTIDTEPMTADRDPASRGDEVSSTSSLRNGRARMSDSERTRFLAVTLLFGVTQLGVVLTVALVAFTPISVGDSYWADLLRGLVFLGFAVPFLFAPIAIAAATEPRLRAAGDRAASRST